jgi:hypothetical protein
VHWQCALLLHVGAALLTVLSLRTPASPLRLLMFDSPCVLLVGTVFAVR